MTERQDGIDTLEPDCLCSNPDSSIYSSVTLGNYLTLVSQHSRLQNEDSNISFFTVVRIACVSI